jgi:imidazole glycerol-phosphate synthase subunit HisF
MRIIPKLEIKSGYLVKGRQLEGYRKIGDPNLYAERYYLEGADEICFIDIVASLYNRKLICDIVKNISTKIFVPFSVGGGIKSFEQIREIFGSGADKIHLNSHLFTDLNFIEKFEKIYGGQSISVEIQTKLFEGNYYCFYDRGREFSGIKLLDWLKKLNNFNFGELIITDIERDGMKKGVNLELIDLVKQKIDQKNLVYSGGFNPNIDDILLLKKNLDGLMIALSLHENLFSIKNFSERFN